jgi:hypothetical protein
MLSVLPHLVLVYIGRFSCNMRCQGYSSSTHSRKSDICIGEYVTTANQRSVMMNRNLMQFLVNITGNVVIMAYRNVFVTCMIQFMAYISMEKKSETILLNSIYFLYGHEWNFVDAGVGDGQRTNGLDFRGDTDLDPGCFRHIRMHWEIYYRSDATD